MRYYETLYMINPNLSDEEYREVVAKCNGLIEKQKAVIVHVDEWGKKSLAYTVKKFDKASYVLLYYCAEGSAIAEIERGLQLDERILKYQTVKLSDQADPEALKAKAEEKKKDTEEQPELSEEEKPEDQEDTVQEDKE